MAERKIVEVKEEKKQSKGLNIDLSELKKIGAAILAFIAANPDLISKLLNKPAGMLKKIVNGEDVSKTTKKKVNSVINDNKSGGIASILGGLSSLSEGDSETTSMFGNISSMLSAGQASGVDVGSLVGGLLGGTTSKKKTSKKSSSTSSGLGSLLRGLFK